MKKDMEASGALLGAALVLTCMACTASGGEPPENAAGTASSGGASANGSTAGRGGSDSGTAMAGGGSAGAGILDGGSNHAGAAAGAAGAAGAGSPALTSNWDRVQAAFGNIETLAGAGQRDVALEWLPEFEGGKATAAELARPHIALADADNNLYIADKESHAIRRVSPDGIITTVAGTGAMGDFTESTVPALEGALSNPNGLWVQPDGTLYIVDLGNSKIRKVTPEGVMSTLIELPSLGAGRGLWVAPDESEVLIAVTSELQRWTPADGVTTLASGFSSLGMVLRAPNGKIWVGDRSGHSVYEVDDDGNKTRIAGNGASAPFVEGALATETALDEPRAIWPYDGGMFIGSHDSCRVFYVDDAGQAHLFLDGADTAHNGDGESYATPGLKIGELRSLSIAPNGDLIIVENDVGYVRVVRATR